MYVFEIIAEGDYFHAIFGCKGRDGFVALGA